MGGGRAHIACRRPMCVHAPIVALHTRRPTKADILTCHSREVSGQTLQGPFPQSMAVNLSMASHVDAPAAAVRAAQMTSPAIDFQNETTNVLRQPVRTGAPHLAGQQEGMLNVGLGEKVKGNASLAVQGKAIGGPLDVDYVNDQFGEFLTRLSSLLPQVRERGRDRWFGILSCVMTLLTGCRFLPFLFSLAGLPYSLTPLQPCALCIATSQSKPTAHASISDVSSLGLPLPTSPAADKKAKDGPRLPRRLYWIKSARGHSARGHGNAHARTRARGKLGQTPGGKRGHTNRRGRGRGARGSGDRGAHGRGARRRGRGVPGGESYDNKRLLESEQPTLNQEGR